MTRNSKNAITIVAVIVVVAAVGIIAWAATRDDDATETVALAFDFDEGAEGWTPLFADYPVDDPDPYELESDVKSLPDGLDGNALYLRGVNLSADLYMMWTRRIDGLAPNSVYDLEVVVGLATNVPSGGVGLGGSPTESQFLKVGGAGIPIETMVDGLGLARLNINDGNQSQSGPNGAALGTLDNPNVVEGPEPVSFALHTVDGSGGPVSVTTDENGSAWVSVGVDSGFEGVTEVYFSQLDVTLTPASG